MSKLPRGRGRFGRKRFIYFSRPPPPHPRAIIPDARPLGTFENQDSRDGGISKRSREKIEDCEQSKELHARPTNLWKCKARQVEIHRQNILSLVYLFWEGPTFVKQVMSSKRFRLQALQHCVIHQIHLQSNGTNTISHCLYLSPGGY